MNRTELAGRVTEELKARNYRKHVTASKDVLTISDADGNKKDFVVRHAEKNLYLNCSDVRAVIDAAIDIMIDALAVGDQINIRGFGVLGLKYRKPRASKQPMTEIWHHVPGRWVPKFTYSSVLADSARKYQLTLEKEQSGVAQRNAEMEEALLAEQKAKEEAEKKATAKKKEPVYGWDWDDDD